MLYLNLNTEENCSIISKQVLKNSNITTLYLKFPPPFDKIVRSGISIYGSVTLDQIENGIIKKVLTLR
jgi:hypothetical protein